MKKLFILCYFIFAQVVFAQIPEIISYQGVLADAQGNAVSDGSYSLTFNLYESATGGGSIWSETQDIEVVNGLFNAILGSVKPLSNSFDRPYWLGIAIGSDPELEPRIELTASAYSLNVRSVADSAVTSGKIADGQVVRVLQISPIDGLTSSFKDTVRLKAGPNITFDAEGGPNAGIIISAVSSNSSGDGHSLDASDGDPTDALFVDAEGRVGIGTTTPTARLHVVNTGTGHGMKLHSDLTGFIVEHAGVDGLSIHFAGRHGVQVGQAGNPSAFNNNTESNAFMVQGAEGFGLYVGHADQDGVHVESAGGDGVEVASANGFGIRAKGLMGAAFFDGNVGIGTTSPGNILTIQKNSATDPIADAWTTYSSRRWKTNIKTIESPLEKVQRLRGVTYDWKKSGKHDIGLIAEEVGEVIPEIVVYEENGIDAKSVDYPRLAACSN